MSTTGDAATFDLETYLEQAEQVILPVGEYSNLTQPKLNGGRMHIGVDLGTAYVVLLVLDENFHPLVGEYQFAQVARDGLVVDYIGAVDLLRDMKKRLEDRLGVEISHAATGFPPGVPRAEIRATGNVVEAAGFKCTSMVDEPSAANHLLQIQNGAVIDVGGGTTGIAIVKDGKVVYSADEPTGGTHFSLVIAGALNISFEEAEVLKKTPSEQARLFPLIRPVMEKVASITARHIKGKDVHSLTLVGGTACFPGMGDVIQEYVGIPTITPTRPLFITPIGIAMNDKGI